MIQKLLKTVLKYWNRFQRRKWAVAQYPLNISSLSLSNAFHHNKR